MYSDIWTIIVLSKYSEYVEQKFLNILGVQSKKIFKV